MQNGLMVLHGNRLETLTELVADWLQREPLSPLETETFLVQSNGMAQWLKLQLADALGISHKLSTHRDLADTAAVRFDTVVCLDVLEHLPDPSAQLLEFHNRMQTGSVALLNWYFFKGHQGQYPFHFDDPGLVEQFFQTLQSRFLEIFHPLLITTRTYQPMG